MNRRSFLQAATALGPGFALGQFANRADPLERMTAAHSPTIALSQVGFRPDNKKRVIVRQSDAKLFIAERIGNSDFRMRFPLEPVKLDMESVLIGDFSEIAQPGQFRIRVNNEESSEFVIQPDAWRSHLPLVISYHRAQRCGVEIPGVHPACHLDDARRRDNGQHLDLTGGWHDAGDLRKWMDATMMNAFGLLAVARNLGINVDDEVRWGNVYFLKMQDTDGRVWADVAGGVNGDNSDNHWTDNVVGTSDDRYLNTGKGGPVQAMFTALQAMYADHFRSDTAYSARCLEAAKKCWNASRREGETEEMSWWVLAAVEMFRTTKDAAYANAGKEMADRLVSLQQRQGGAVNGYWPMSKKWDEPYKNPTHGALPPFVLLEAARTFGGGDAWRAAVKLHIENYVEPMASRSAYGIVPFGLFKGSPTEENYRPLEAGLTYRYFMPVRKQFWWLGLSGHLTSHALMLATAARDLGQSRWRDLAYGQLEWVFGMNPFGISVASGIGSNIARPFSKFVGEIPGGIMNGICGNADDAPVMDLTHSPTWRSNEYWSPHVGYFEWTQSVLESA